MSSIHVWVYPQSLIEVRQFFRTNLIKLLLSDYTVHEVFARENFVIF